MAQATILENYKLSRELEVVKQKNTRLNLSSLKNLGNTLQTQAKQIREVKLLCETMFASSTKQIELFYKHPGLKQIQLLEGQDKVLEIHL